MSSYFLKISTTKKQNLDLILQRISKIELEHETSNYFLVKVIWFDGQIGLDSFGKYFYCVTIKI